MDKFQDTTNKKLLKFIHLNCSKCKKDKFMSSDIKITDCDESEFCPILTQAFSAPVPEWVFEEDRYPYCLNFLE